MSRSFKKLQFKALVATSVILSGCGSFTESRSPNPDEGVPLAPDKFLHNEAPSSEAIISSPEAWWRIFNDPTLDSLIEKLENANPDIEAALARMDQSFAVLGITRSALFPTVKGELSAGRRRDSLNNLLFPLSTPEYERYGIGVSASWEWDLWGRVRGTVKRDRLRAEAEKFDFQYLLLSLQANLARQYFAIRSTEAELKILKDAVRIREENLNLQESRLKLGTGVEIDVARARVEFHNALAVKESVTRKLGKLKHAIAVLIGVATSEFKGELPTTEKTSLATPVIPPGIPSSLLDRRADLRAADQTLRAAAIQIGIRKSDFLPKITLNGSSGLASLKSSDLFSADSQFFDIGPKIDIPIFQARARQSSLDHAKAQWQEAVANYRSTVLTAVREVDDALLDLQSLQRELMARNEAVNAATQTAESAKNRHDSGLASYFEFIDAERERLQAKLSENSLIGERRAAAVSLIQALGGSW
jgi:multidrug efflux system outer membrane protein